MPISDKKKSQSFINACADKVEELDAIATQLENLRTAFTSQSVDPAGTPLDGYTGQVSTWIDSIRTAADNAIANGLVANRVPTHCGTALGV